MAKGVTLCVPAYRAEAFLTETLESAFAQGWPNCQLVISVDRADDDTAGLARRLTANRPGVRVFEQPQRLGWIGNTNFALAQARTRYAMVLPHDDLLGPDYVAAAMDQLRASPRAVAAYSDMSVIGDPTAIILQASIAGSFAERMADIFANHFNSVAYRAMLDLDRVRGLGVPQSIASFAADTLWFTRLACRGELIRTQGIRYYKRMLPTSTHAAWMQASEAELHQMWAVHCYEMLEVVRNDGPKPVDFPPELQRAWISRVLGGNRYMAGKRNPLFADTSRTIPEHVAHTYASVRTRRPVPYSWVKA